MPVSATRPGWSLAASATRSSRRFSSLPSAANGRPASRAGRGVELQVAAVQLHSDPGIGHRGTDGLVAGQRTGRAVDQEQLKLGTYRGGTGPEARQLEELRERGQAFPSRSAKRE